MPVTMIPNIMLITLKRKNNNNAKMISTTMTATIVVAEPELHNLIKINNNKNPQLRREFALTTTHNPTMALPRTVTRLVAAAPLTTTKSSKFKNSWALFPAKI